MLAQVTIYKSEEFEYSHEIHWKSKGRIHEQTGIFASGLSVFIKLGVYCRRFFFTYSLIETQKSGTGRGHPIDEFDEALRLYKNCLSCTRHYLEEPNCIPELVLYNADPDDLNYKCGKFVCG